VLFGVINIFQLVSKQVHSVWIKFLSGILDSFTMNTPQSLSMDSNEEIDLQMAYNMLFKKFVKFTHRHQISLKKLNDVEHEKESLVIKLSKSHTLIDSLKSKNTMLIDKLGAFTSHAFNSERKTLFVKLVKVEEVKANIACLDKGKTSYMNICVNPELKAISRKQTHAKFVPTCHHCGIIGHIRPNCSKLKSQRPWNKKDAPKKEKGGVESCLSRSKYRYIPSHKREAFSEICPYLLSLWQSWSYST
jgi:hypothetical protein